jgi:diaminohydroxyphosphoribosylaminopyrimidine deaminase/5-amino-6-(5-phosphoribosylamino)uracil reductase
VLDSRLRLDDGCQLVQSARQAPVWVVCGLEAPARPAAALERAGVRVVRLPIREGRVDLPCLLEELGRHSVTSLLVEGGAGVLGAFLEAGLADELFLFLAPKILADPGAVPLFRGAVRHAMTEAIDLPWIEVKRFGDDVLVHARFRAEIY